MNVSVLNRIDFVCILNEEAPILDQINYARILDHELSFQFNFQMATIKKLKKTVKFGNGFRDVKSSWQALGSQ